MFVTLCVVREAAPSVPVCEGSDQRSCTFEPIQHTSHAYYSPADSPPKHAIDLWIVTFICLNIHAALSYLLLLVRYENQLSRGLKLES